MPACYHTSRASLTSAWALSSASEFELRPRLLSGPRASSRAPSKRPNTRRAFQRRIAGLSPHYSAPRSNHRESGHESQEALHVLVLHTLGAAAVLSDLPQQASEATGARLLHHHMPHVCTCDSSSDRNDSRRASCSRPSGIWRSRSSIARAAVRFLFEIEVSCSTTPQLPIGCLAVEYCLLTVGHIVQRAG